MPALFQILEHSAALPEGALVIANTENVLALGDAVRGARAVVLQFPKWTDGRAYSQAFLLRARLGFGGEIRATGDVVVDMLPLLRRCGFDAVQLREGQSVQSAQSTLGQFPAHYQGDATGAKPVFAALAS
jgi:uncharacterized protein (DUF934 family)